MAFEAFSPVDWYEAPGRGMVAVIRTAPGYDPAPLVGQLVTLNGVSHLVAEVVTGVYLPAGTAPSDEFGTTFGLLVS